MPPTTRDNAPAHLPSGAARLAARHPKIWQAYAELGERCAEEGPLDARTRRLAKLALAIGAGSEGAVHSHVRRALAEGISAAELHHVMLLAIPLVGLPAATKAMTWIDDLVEHSEE
jgi:alkylhydroperoxidase/carboxymuconolactone decarboxylase family protein YurZ